jgi:serine/threonine protein kinase
VVIKVFHAPMAAPAISDARVWAWMGHPNLVQVHELGESEGRPFLVMEHLEGRCLRALLVDLLARQRRLPVPVAVCVAAQVARGLTHAQARAPDEDRASLTHIDVTPSNIMVLRDGGVKLLDSGILGSDELAPRMLESGPGNVRLSYWAPERLLWRRERRSDLFSLGVVLWESLIGRSLFRTGMPAKTLDNVVQRLVPPPSHFRAEIPTALDRVVLRALERDPEQRPASAEALADDLEALLDADPRPSLARLMEELAACGSPPRPLPPAPPLPSPLRPLPPPLPAAARRVPLRARVPPAVALAGLALTAVSLAVGWHVLARAPSPTVATRSSASDRVAGSGAPPRALVINATAGSAARQAAPARTPARLRVARPTARRRTAVSPPPETLGGALTIDPFAAGETPTQRPEGLW